MTDSDTHEICTSIIGQSIGRSEVMVTARKTMAYAAGIGAERTVYFDDVPIAPPSFIVSLEWALLNGELYRNLLDAPQPVMERAVHLTQASQFHRPIRADAKLVTRGIVHGLRQARQGVIVTVALETVDTEGTPVATSTFVALFLRSKLDAMLPTMVAIDEPVHHTRTDKTGTLLVPLGTAHTYTECSGIWNPIHTERRAARHAGFPAPIIHGTWTWASALEWAIDQWCDGDPTLMQSWTGRFVAPVVPGAILKFEGDVEERSVRLSAMQADKECFVASGEIGPP